MMPGITYFPARSTVAAPAGILSSAGAVDQRESGQHQRVRFGFGALAGRARHERKEEKREKRLGSGHVWRVYEQHAHPTSTMCGGCRALRAVPSAQDVARSTKLNEGRPHRAVASGTVSNSSSGLIQNASAAPRRSSAMPATNVIS